MLPRQRVGEQERGAVSCGAARPKATRRDAVGRLLVALFGSGTKRNKETRERQAARKRPKRGCFCLFWSKNGRVIAFMATTIAPLPLGGTETMRHSGHIRPKPATSLAHLLRDRPSALAFFPVWL